MSSLSSLLMSRFHMASAVNAGFVSSFWSKQAIFVFSQDKLDDFGDVPMLLNGVFGFRPNCASNGVTFIVAFGVILKVSRQMLYLLMFGN